MEQYISKAAVVAELERLYNLEYDNTSNLSCGKKIMLRHILSFLDTLDVKEVDTWHLQEKENIYDAIKDWSPYTFACLMKDGTIQRFSGCLAEDCEGHINIHIDGVNDDYDNVDDIVKWIEYT